MLVAPSPEVELPSAAQDALSPLARVEEWRLRTPPEVMFTADLMRDLAPVAQVSTFDYVLAVNAKSSINSMQELVQQARKQPGKLTWPLCGG